MKRLITFPRITDPRGSLSFAEKLPFQIKRVYWVYLLSAEAERGGHAHKKLERIIVPLSGSFTAYVDDVAYPLFKPWEGLYIAPMEWLDLRLFSGNAAFMTLASAEYDEGDYIRERL